MLRRQILHLRLRGLFTAVQAREQPLLLGQPFALASNTPGSRLLDVSPGALRLGLMPGMAVWQAKTMRPDLILAPPDLAAYEAAYGRVLETLLRFTPQAKPHGLSEAFVDVTGSLRLYGGREKLARSLREAVCETAEACLRETSGADRWPGEVPYSVTLGLGPNLLLARIATLLAEPGTAHALFPQQPAEELAGLPLDYLWLVETGQRQRLAQMGVRTFGQLQMIPSVLLRREFGDAGEVMFEAARGRDETLIPVYEAGDTALMIRHRTDLPRPLRQFSALRLAGLALADRLAHSLQAREQSARRLRVTLTLVDRRRVDHTVDLEAATDDQGVLRSQVEKSLSAMHLGAQSCVSLEVAASDLQQGPGPRQLSLFEERPLREPNLAEAKDRVSRKLGEKALVAGSVANTTL